MRNGRTLIADHIADTALQERLGDGENALAAEFLTGADLELKDFFREGSFGHWRCPILSFPLCGEGGEQSPIFPLARCAAMGEGGRRPGEGSLPARGRAFWSFAYFEEEPSSALRAPSPILRTGEGGMRERGVQGRWCDR